MRALLLPLVAATVFAIVVLFSDDPRPRDPLDASAPPRPIDEILQYLDEQTALN